MTSNHERALPAFIDSFSDERRPGNVIGTALPEGISRGGVDLEDVIAIDGGALRIKPLTKPGWKRAGLAYGPYRRVPGLLFAVAILNAHNTSQAENLPEGLAARFKRWLLGSEHETHPRVAVKRALQWLQSPYKANVLRRFQWWVRISRRYRIVPKLNENLAVGWFASEAPADPCSEGNAFVMHALEGQNGELWTRVQSQMAPTISGVQNLPLFLVVVLRERGAAYYAASLPGASGFTAFPRLRPLAIDATGDDPLLYAGIQQSVLGQIGFRVDTRVYAAQVAHDPDLAAHWYGTAHAADRLGGSGALAGTHAQCGGVWDCAGATLERTARGVVVARGGGTEPALALLQPDTPSGLVHVNLVLSSEGGSRDGSSAGLVFRVLDAQNMWCFEVSGEMASLSVIEAGRQHWVARAAIGLSPSNQVSVQILDDGASVSVFTGGQRVFAPVIDARHALATGVGLRTSGEACFTFDDFEAHARSIPMFAQLKLPPPWSVPESRVLAEDGFAGPAGPLHGRATTVGNKPWERTLGSGHYDVSGRGSVQVQASVERPNTGRTAYTIAWDRPSLADLEVEITPPGTQRGQREAGRCGLIFWQDPANYVTISHYLDDAYDGASVALFFHIGGFEELYDAVWTMVADRVTWGRATRFRTVFDGMRFMAYLDDEPVLYRALRDVYPKIAPLQIRRVGLVTNWEWGNDTGSVLRNFVAKG